MLRPPLLAQISITYYKTLPSSYSKKALRRIPLRLIRRPPTLSPLPVQWLVRKPSSNWSNSIAWRLTNSKTCARPCNSTRSYRQPLPQSRDEARVGKGDGSIVDTEIVRVVVAQEAQLATAIACDRPLRTTLTTAIWSPTQQRGPPTSPLLTKSSVRTTCKHCAQSFCTMPKRCPTHTPLPSMHLASGRLELWRQETSEMNRQLDCNFVDDRVQRVPRRRRSTRKKKQTLSHPLSTRHDPSTCLSCPVLGGYTRVRVMGKAVDSPNVLPRWSSRSNKGYGRQRTARLIVRPNEQDESG